MTGARDETDPGLAPIFPAIDGVSGLILGRGRAEARRRIDARSALAGGALSTVRGPGAGGAALAIPGDGVQGTTIRKTWSLLEGAGPALAHRRLDVGPRTPRVPAARPVRRRRPALGAHAIAHRSAGAVAALPRLPRRDQHALTRGRGPPEAALAGAVAGGVAADKIRAEARGALGSVAAKVTAGSLAEPRHAEKPAHAGVRLGARGRAHLAVAAVRKTALLHDGGRLAGAIPVALLFHEGAPLAARRRGADGTDGGGGPAEPEAVAEPVGAAEGPVGLAAVLRVFSGGNRAAEPRGAVALVRGLAGGAGALAGRVAAHAVGAVT
jgi:hypothetical protein